MLLTRSFRLFSRSLHLPKSKDWSVENYVINSSPQLKHAMQILHYDNWFATFAKQFCNKSATIIDLGCGDAKVTALLAEQFPKFSFIGVDCSFSMIDYAKSTHRDRPNLSFVCQDISDENFPKIMNKKVDCILSFSAIHWVGNQKQFYENIQAISKPSTKFCIMFYSKDSYLWESIHRTASSDRWKKYFPNYETPYYGGTEELRALFKKQGIDPSYEIVSQQYPSDGRAQLKNYLLGITPVYEPLQKSLESEGLNQQDIQKMINAFLEDVIHNIISEKNSTFVENKKDGSSTFFYQRGLFRSILKRAQDDDIGSEVPGRVFSLS